MEIEHIEGLLSYLPVLNFPSILTLSINPKQGVDGYNCIHGSSTCKACAVLEKKYYYMYNSRCHSVIWYFY